MCVKSLWEFSVVGVEEYNGKYVGVLWTMDQEGRGRRRGGRGNCGDLYHDHHSDKDTFSKSIALKY